MIDFDVLEKLSTPKVWDGNTWVDLAAELRETRSKLAIAVEIINNIGAKAHDSGDFELSQTIREALAKIRGG